MADFCRNIRKSKGKFGGLDEGTTMAEICKNICRS